MSRKQKINSTGCKHNEVSFNTRSIVFGRSISDLFRQYNVRKLIIICDYKNNSLIFKPDNSYGLGTRYPPDENWNDFMQLKFIKFITPPIGCTVVRQAFRFTAKRFNESSVIIENFPLDRCPIISGNKIFVNVDSQFIVIGKFRKDMNTKLVFSDKELNRQQVLSVEDKRMITTTPSTRKMQSTATPSQPITRVSPIVHKELGSNDSPNDVAKISTTIEEQNMADKAYAKMILGE